MARPSCIPNTATRRRSGGSSRAPRRSGTRPGAASARRPCRARRAWRATVRRNTNNQDMADPEDELAGTEQPFVAHLIELRDRLIRAMVAVLVVAAVLFIWPGPAKL